MLGQATIELRSWAGTVKHAMGQAKGELSEALDMVEKLWALKVAEADILDAYRWRGW